jgi:hypothetical protein
VQRNKLPALKSSARLPAPATAVRLPAGVNVAPLFDTPVFLPTGGFDVDRAIKCLAAFLSKMQHKLSSKFSREWAETTIIRKLREGRLDLAREAIGEAEAGDEIFYAAVCA